MDGQMDRRSLAPVLLALHGEYSSTFRLHRRLSEITALNITMTKLIYIGVIVKIDFCLLKKNTEDTKTNVWTTGAYVCTIIFRSSSSRNGIRP